MALLISLTACGGNGITGEVERCNYVFENGEPVCKCKGHRFRIGSSIVVPMNIIDECLVLADEASDD